MKFALLIIVVSSVVFAQTRDSLSETIENSIATQSIKVQQPVTSAQKKKQIYHPIAFDTSGLGSLSISTYPQKTEVYVNGQFVGKGNQLLTNMKTGIYCVKLKYESENKENYVLVQNNKLATMAGSLGRMNWFVIEPSFSRFFVAGKNSFGPALDLGLQHKNLYFGIDYSWNFGNYSDLFMFGGSAFKFRYCFDYKGMFSISPGMMAGFWYAEYSTSYDDDDEYGYVDDCGYELFFGGISCRACFGYKSVFFKIDDSILFGTTVSNSIKFGMSIKI